MRAQAARNAAHARRSTGRVRAQARLELERASRATERAVATTLSRTRGARARTSADPRDPVADMARTAAEAPSAVARPTRTTPSRPGPVAKRRTAPIVRAPT